MHIEQEFVPREWYEKLWRNFQILENDYENLNFKFKIGLGLWRLLIIIIVICILMYFLIKFIKV